MRTNATTWLNDGLRAVFGRAWDGSRGARHGIARCLALLSVGAACIVGNVRGLHAETGASAAGGGGVSGRAQAVSGAGSTQPGGGAERGGIEYRRLGSRSETRAGAIAKITGSGADWGSASWWMLRAFEHPKGDGDVAAAYPPESFLPGMVVDGPGMDTTARFVGKGKRTIAWERVGETPDIGGMGGSSVDFRDGLEGADGDNAVGYLYKRISAERDTTVTAWMGSDDGLRVWLNGEMLVDANAARALDPHAHRVELALKKGVNHLLIKVSQGKLQWAFQMQVEEGLDPRAEAELDWRLDSDFPDEESRYYRIATVPMEAGSVVEVGGIAVLDDRRVAVSTRRGEVLVIEDAMGLPAVGARARVFASGLQEPLGLAVPARLPGDVPAGSLALACAQRSELTLLVDTDGDSRADEYRTLCADWKLSGNYHEYAFGPKYDADGNAYVTLNLAHTGDETVMGATVETRGWAVRITPEGKMEKVGDGLRSPDGIGRHSDGSMFYTDNQGDYVATNKLSQLVEGAFHGHRASLKFREGFGADWKARGVEAPRMQPPAVWFPYKKMGQSASDIVLDDTGGAFGPFAGQFFVGEQTTAEVFRVFLEKVDGHYQGACFPFRRGFASGVHRMAFAAGRTGGGAGESGDGKADDESVMNRNASLFVGMTDRGWGSVGPKRWGVQRVLWTGEVPMEIEKMELAKDGFMLTFTRELDADAAQLDRYTMKSYTYSYHPDYGSDEMETQELAITGVQVLQGRRTLWLGVAGLRSGPMGYVHELHIDGLRSAPDPVTRERHALLHDRAYYTVVKALP